MIGHHFSSHRGCFAFANRDATFDAINQFICYHNIFGSTFDALEGVDLVLGFCIGLRVRF